MIKQMLKIAGVKNQTEFLKKFPTEESFFKAHPEASMLMSSNNMYQEGGEPMPQGDPGMMAEQQQDPAAQQEQIVQFIIQLIQQNVPPEEIIQKLVEAGLPEEQAQQLVSAVMEKIQAEMQQQAPAEEAAMSAPPEQMAQQPMMRNGGKSYSGTYSGGVYYASGGPTFYPDYTMMAMGGSYDNPGFNALPPSVQDKIKNASKKMYGGSFANGGNTSLCPPGFAWDGEFEKCMPLPNDTESINIDDEDAPFIPNPGSGAGMLLNNNSRRLQAGFGLNDRDYNLSYDVSLNPLNKKDIVHRADLNLTNLFGKGKGLGLQGQYIPNESLNIGLNSPRIPLFGGSLAVNANYDQDLTRDEEGRSMMSPLPNNKTRYNVSAVYDRKLGKRGPNATFRVGYNQQFGGLTKFVGGGEMQEAAPVQQGANQQQAMIQELMTQVAQLLQQGIKPDIIAKDLVKMGMSKDQAMQIISATAKQLGGQSKSPVMPMAVGMYGGSYAAGGKVSKYQKGGEYELDESQINDLVNKGYKIQYM